MERRGQYLRAETGTPYYWRAEPLRQQPRMVRLVGDSELTTEKNPNPPAPGGGGSGCCCGDKRCGGAGASASPRSSSFSGGGLA
ncbi:hypothetical protein MASR2M79_13890 [Aminivibrio sp.]